MERRWRMAARREADVIRTGQKVLKDVVESSKVHRSTSGTSNKTTRTDQSAFTNYTYTADRYVWRPEQGGVQNFGRSGHQLNDVHIEITPKQAVVGMAQEALDLSATNAVDVVGRVGTVAAAGGKEIVSAVPHAAVATVSSTATQINRYTPDIYDVGGYGQGDLTSDAGMFIAGNTAMVAQNAVKTAEIGAKYIYKAREKHVSLQARKAQQKADAIHKLHPLTKKTNAEILTGRTRKDITKTRHRFNPYRFNYNGAYGLSMKKKGNLVWKRWQANKVNRLQRKSQKLENRFMRMKHNQFSLVRSTKGMIGNQSRKLTNMVVSGNDPNSTTNRAIWVSKKGVKFGGRAAKKTAKEMFKHRYAVKKFASAIVHPVRSVKYVISAIISLISSLLSMLTTIPVVASIIVALLPIIIVVLPVAIIVVNIIGWFQIEAAFGNIETVATRDYAANAFIYEAKKRDWKDEAITGVLAYMLAEGLSDMGTFTYESYWAVTGPSGAVRDTLLDNDAWQNWIGGSGKQQMRNTSSYSGRSDIYCAIGIGLMADSDVWQTSSTRSVTNATQLINYCESKGKPWQDPQTQLTYYFEKVFTRSTVFDTPGVDPTKDNRSAEEWCRRITSGYGMPAWSWTTNNQYMLVHVNKVSQAQEYVSNYKAFSYVSLTSGNLSDGPNFDNEKAWKHPYNTYPYGQCTWFAAGRLYEIYGIQDNNLGDGNQWVNNLVNRYPDKFKFSTEPEPGAIYCTGGGGTNKNHVGIVLDVQGDIVTTQDGNFNAATDPWEVAITDWATQTQTKTYMKTYYDAIYAVPK